MTVDKKRNYRAVEWRENGDTPEESVSGEILAKAIIDVSTAAKKLLDGPLTKRAIVILIQDAVPHNIGLYEVEAVLEAAAGLKEHFIKKGKS